MCPAIWTIPATIWKSNFSNCDDRSNRMFSAIARIPVIVTIVNDHMETRLNYVPAWVRISSAWDDAHYEWGTSSLQGRMCDTNQAHCEYKSCAVRERYVFCSILSLVLMYLICILHMLARTTHSLYRVIMLQAAEVIKRKKNKMTVKSEQLTSFMASDM